MWRLPDSEYAKRLEALRQKLVSEGIDALYLTSAPNIFYLTGYFMIKRTTNLAPSRAGVKLKKEDYFPLMSSPGQFLENGGREPTSPAIPGRGPARPATE